MNLVNKLKVGLVVLGLVLGVVYTTPSRAFQMYEDGPNCPLQKGWRTLCNYETRYNYVMPCGQWARWVKQAVDLGPERYKQVIMAGMNNASFNKKGKFYIFLFATDAAHYAVNGAFSTPDVAYVAALQECGSLGKG